MQKKDYISLLHQKDIVKQGIPSGFLNLQEQQTLRQLLDKFHITYQVYSYFGITDRVIFSKNRPKITILEIITTETFTHQMLLGSFFSLQIDSKILGDFIHYQNKYYMYFDAKYKKYILENFRKVGKYSIMLKEVHIHDIQDYKPQLKKEVILVSSYRLDSIISKITGYSRSKVKELFSNGWVRYMDEEIYNGNIVTKENDIFSIRKFGKYQIGSLQGKTKSDKYALEVKKYMF